MGSELAVFSPRKVGKSVQNDTSHGDIVANTLQYYRERTRSSEGVNPKPYKDIQTMLQKTVEEGKRVLIDIKDSYSVQTVVVKFEHVNERWAMGNSTCYVDGEEVKVPYTIHYSDILCKRMKIKVIVEGENPFA